MLHMVCTRITAMRKDWERVISVVQDAALGYAAVVLAIGCFVLGLSVVVALVRLIVGAGA